MFRSFDALGRSHTFEFIVVLNRGTEALELLTDELHEEYAPFCDVRTVVTDVCNLGHLYNIGLLAASFDDCLFIDSDIICAPGAIDKLVDAHEVHRSVTKGRTVFVGGSKLVRQARLVNTTDDVPPYIPIVIVNKNVFGRLNGTFVFAVDVVWCSDAEFAYRVLESGVEVTFVDDAEFFHDAVLKTDVRDAWLYGLGKGNRINRTGEAWHPLGEILATARKARTQVGWSGVAYATFWIALQQLACWRQVGRQNLFDDAMPFAASLMTADLNSTIKEMR